MNPPPEKPESGGVDLDRWNEEFETLPAGEILRIVTGRFGDKTVLTMSFQHEGVVIAHLLRDIAPSTPVLFIDTGYHFPETLSYRNELVERFQLPIRNLRSTMPRQEFLTRHGDRLYESDPDLCCRINKVEPMQLALEGVEAWINGRRRDQANTRTKMPIAERLKGGIIKVNPLANWTSKDTYEYLIANGIPLHPLFEQGYASIGCAPCTRPILAGEDERAGRWSGRGKTECGLHTLLTSEEEDASPESAAATAGPSREG